MPEPETIQDIHFPKAGVSRSVAFGRQPSRQQRDKTYIKTCAFAANVRGYDPSSGRDRGGSRSGLTKWIATQVVGVEWIVQYLGTFVSTLGSVLVPQLSQSGRVVYVLAVSQGVLKVATPTATVWTATVNNTGNTPALNFSGVMQSAANNQKMYFVDGINYAFYAPVTNSLEAWVATAGTLPADTAANSARLICTWRGRTVLSGLLLDPQNWFMSKVSDPNNYEYSPTPTTRTDAVAGNNSPLGLIGDVVTGLIPYSDDVLIFLGDHTIYSMRGDPADGGQIDLISDITGGAFGEAWCKDPYGNIYFFGNKPSVWMLSGGVSQPVRISDAIDPLLQSVDTGRNIIRLVWNDREQGVHIFITKDDAPAATTHYFYDKRTSAWWPDTFADNDYNPVAIIALDGNEADDRAILIGGWDGYVRKITHDAPTDDGTVINSEVFLGPIMTQTLDEMLLKELQFVMGETSGQVSWEVMAGDTAESALAAAARATGVADAGRNGTQPVRVADHAIYVRITATTRWAMETVRAVFAGRGKVRRRKP